MPLTVPRAYDFIWSFQFLPLLTRKNSLASIIQLFSPSFYLLISFSILSLCFISSFIQLLLFFLLSSSSQSFCSFACLQLTPASCTQNSRTEITFIPFLPFTHWFHLQKQKKGWKWVETSWNKVQNGYYNYWSSFPFSNTSSASDIENFFVFRFKSFEKKDNRVDKWVSHNNLLGTGIDQQT